MFFKEIEMFRDKISCLSKKIFIKLIDGLKLHNSKIYLKF